MSETNPPTWDPDAIDWEDIERVSGMTPMERIIGSLQLQKRSREFALMGIRQQNPDVGEEEIIRMLDERMNAGRPWDRKHG